MSIDLHRIYNDGFKHGEWRAIKGLPLDKTPCEQYDNEIQNGTWDCGEKCGWFYQTGLKLSESNVSAFWMRLTQIVLDYQLTSNN